MIFYLNRIYSIYLEYGNKMCIFLIWIAVLKAKTQL